MCAKKIEKEELLRAAEELCARAIREDFEEFSSMFATDTEAAPPTSPLLAKRRLQQMSANHAPARLFEVLDRPNILVAAPAQDLDSTISALKADDDLFNRTIAALDAEAALTAELADLMDDLIVIWRQAVYCQDDPWHETVTKGLSIWYFQDRPFTDISSALQNSTVAPSIDAYFDGVPLEDIVVEEKAWHRSQLPGVFL